METILSCVFFGCVVFHAFFSKRVPTWAVSIFSLGCVAGAYKNTFLSPSKVLVVFYFVLGFWVILLSPVKKEENKTPSEP